MPAPTTRELLWGTPDRPRRGPKPSLTLERIVAEAVDLADAEGLASLSMARLAERLGCAKMALYRYVPGKTELTALMLDAALSSPPENHTDPADPESWRAYLREWSGTFFGNAVAHPWLNELATGVRVMGPNELAWLETALAVLDRSGLTHAERLDTVVLLLNHVRGMGLQTGTAGVDLEGELAREMTAVFLTQADRFPHAAVALAEAVPGTESAATAGRDNALDYGIERILDGVASLIATRR
ncbi:TetR/AcrR family transcriptional regulator [Nocardia sp. NPDC004340]|uniref:TetR/AcrR family transcriptional regulator n=1 Tax=Nocardia sp. CA-136227 TaxID=3239979 RepID=UPI003D968197